MKRRKQFIAFILAAHMVVSILPAAFGLDDASYASKNFAATGTTLSINWNNIASVGK